jgi:helicase
MIIDSIYGVPGELNPLQEMVLPFIDSYDNMLICGKTSSGKSACATMMAAKYLINSDEDVVLYCGSYRALCDEKWEDLTHEDHAWSKFKSTAITGDYFYDESKLAEIAEARILMITPEMLISTLTNRNAERSNFLERVKIVLCDEIHEVSNGDRGPNYENAIVELCRENPHVQLILLSGTLPNHEDFTKWATTLTGRTTHYITSEYRPVELVHNFIPLKKERTIADTELNIINAVTQLHQRPDKLSQQFMNCVFKKTFGTKLTNALVKQGVASEFHNANATKAQRNKMEKAFKGGGIRSLTSTSTLFTGVNLPARNVIITWPIAGGGDIPAYVIQQAAGRAGRPKYDTEGDVYYFLPSTDFERHRDRILNGENIMSNMGYKDVIHTHFIRAIYKGVITKAIEFEQWFSKTLAYLQYSYTKESCHELALELVEDLRRWNMLKLTKDPNDLSITRRGVITSQMLLSPRAVFQLVNNFNKYFSLSNPNDLDLARCLGCTEETSTEYLGFADKAAISTQIRNSGIADIYQKAVHCIYSQLTGREVEGLFFSTLWQVKEFILRYMAAIIRIHNESEKWTVGEVDAEEKLRLINIRAMKGLSWDRARLSIKGFTKTEIRALNEVGILNADDARNNSSLARSVLKERRVLELGLG